MVTEDKNFNEDYDRDHEVMKMLKEREEPT